MTLHTPVAPREGARYAADGRTVRLGALLGRGGEGAVHAVQGQAGVAAKLYRPEIAAARAPKIAAMLGLGLAERAALVAFPAAALRDWEGRFAGFLMPRVAKAQPLHELTSPGARKRCFPEADYRFVVRAALNAARAVAGAHAAGCVIGDVNHSGFLIGEDARVALIDADSFQVEAAGRLWPCRVAVPEFTPPELQGAVLAETRRTADHDAFGLAVALFQLLFLGRHPYAGVAKGEDLAVEEAIAAHAFAYAARRGRLTPPRGTLRLSELPPAVAALFEAAFAPDAAGRRPSAEAWVDALAGMEARLAQCAAVPRHFHAAERCPWCRIERGGRTKLFPAPGEIGAAPKPPKTSELRRRLDAVVLPETFFYAPPQPLSYAPPPPKPLGRRLLSDAFTAAVAATMGCAAWIVWNAPQTFLMSTPICIYGWYRVTDRLFPVMRDTRALRRLDKDVAAALETVREAAPLDAAWRMRADVAAALARGKAADLRRAAAELPKLEEAAARLADARTARDPRLDALLRRRADAAARLAARGAAPQPAPAPQPRALRPATRALLARG